jgi:Ca2+-transporting ATPase
MAFTAIILFQLFYALSCRSEEQTLFEAGIFSNKFLVSAVLLSVFLQVLIIYLPPLQNIFNTVPLDLNDWVMVLGISSTAFIIPEIWKTLNRRKE